MEIDKKAYAEILTVLKKYKDVCIYDVNDLEEKASIHLFGIELKEKHGFNIDPRSIHSLDYNKIGYYLVIGLYGEKYKRTLSWSDDGEQPKNELLLSIQFPTGAYIFGDGYPEEIFKEFWQELKSYNPEYCDTTNNHLFFSMDNAGKIFNKFDSVLKKYYEKNREQYKKRQIDRLKKEVEELEK